MNQRAELVEQLLRMERPVPLLLAELRGFGWDSDRVLASLDREHIVSTLKRYLHGEISAAEVEEWANAIEGREDIGLKTTNSDTIQAALHELANPLLTRPLSRDVAEEWIGRLS